jgi:hypothetical protein
MRMPEVKNRMVDTINMKTLLRFRNLWYLVDLAFQVPRDIILDPLTIGILPFLCLGFNLKTLFIKINSFSKQ